MSFWDDQAGYDLSDPKHPTWPGRMAEAADFAVKQAKENPPHRFLCPFGCGADFLTTFAREAHIICDHEKDAA